MFVVVLVMRIRLGLVLGLGQLSHQADQGQCGEGSLHRKRRGDGLSIRCSLLSVECQSLLAAPLKLGEVASCSGLTVKTIRSEGGYRLLGVEVFAELVLIRTLRAMDIPLQDVTRILVSRLSSVCPCSSLQAMVHSKPGETEQNITALLELHVELMGLLRDWQNCGGRKPSAA